VAYSTTGFNHKGVTGRCRVVLPVLPSLTG
jgi:hypothetical protein